MESEDNFTTITTDQWNDLMELVEKNWKFQEQHKYLYLHVL
jgi:hypothetical protein